MARVRLGRHPFRWEVYTGPETREFSKGIWLSLPTTSRRSRQPLSRCTRFEPIPTRFRIGPDRPRTRTVCDQESNVDFERANYPDHVPESALPASSCSAIPRSRQDCPLQDVRLDGPRANSKESFSRAGIWISYRGRSRRRRYASQASRLRQRVTRHLPLQQHHSMCHRRSLHR